MPSVFATHIQSSVPGPCPHLVNCCLSSPSIRARVNPYFNLSYVMDIPPPLSLRCPGIQAQINQWDSPSVPPWTFHHYSSLVLCPPLSSVLCPQQSPVISSQWSPVWCPQMFSFLHPLLSPVLCSPVCPVLSSASTNLS